MLKSGIYDFVICRGGTDMCFVLGFGRQRPDLKQYRISGLTSYHLIFMPPYETQTDMSSTIPANLVRLCYYCSLLSHCLVCMLGCYLLILLLLLGLGYHIIIILLWMI